MTEKTLASAASLASGNTLRLPSESEDDRKARNDKVLAPSAAIL